MENDKEINFNNDRYIIVEGSSSGHCCFQYTIVDTLEGKESYGDYWKKSLCETFERAEAEIICVALNKHSQKKG
jgi:hypothetical protein